MDTGVQQMKTQQYFMDMAECEKHLKHCMAEIGFNNCSSAVEFVLQTVGTVEKYTGPHQYQFGQYQVKDPNTQIDAVARGTDMQTCSKCCKNAISEIDFNNL